MTSANGNIFGVTGHLCGEFTGPRWIPLTKASDARALMFSLICAWINGWVNNREAGNLRRCHAHYDVIVMCVRHCITVFNMVLYWAIDCLSRGCQLARGFCIHHIFCFKVKNILICIHVNFSVDFNACRGGKNRMLLTQYFVSVRTHKIYHQISSSNKKTMFHRFWNCPLVLYCNFHDIIMMYQIYRISNYSPSRKIPPTARGVKIISSIAMESVKWVTLARMNTEISIGIFRFFTFCPNLYRRITCSLLLKQC